MINSFHGYYRFLSNFWPAAVPLDGVLYPSVEHAYQAAKTLDRKDREYIRNLQTPGLAKRAGRRVVVRPDWEQVKLSVMEELLRAKFTHNENLKLALLNTRDEELIEGNVWNDTFWGVCRGQGENHLGKLLMKIRSELRT